MIEHENMLNLCEYLIEINNVIVPGNSGKLVTMTEKFIMEQPIHVVKSAFDYLVAKDLLHKTDLVLAIMTTIIVNTDGKGLELEDAFPQYKGVNPYYSFRKFRVNVINVGSTDQHDGYSYLKLQELNADGTESKNISDISVLILDVLLHQVLVPDLSKFKGMHDFFEKGGVFPLSRNLKSFNAVFDCKKIEEGFRIVEAFVSSGLMNISFKRPRYLELVKC